MTHNATVAEVMEAAHERHAGQHVRLEPLRAKQGGIIHGQYTIAVRPSTLPSEATRVGETEWQTVLTGTLSELFQQLTERATK